MFNFRKKFLNINNNYYNNDFNRNMNLTKDSITIKNLTAALMAAVLFYR